MELLQALQDSCSSVEHRRLLLSSFSFSPATRLRRNLTTKKKIPEVSALINVLYKVLYEVTILRTFENLSKNSALSDALDKVTIKDF